MKNNLLVPSNLGPIKRSRLC